RPLVEHRRAFFPGESVRLAFKLPPGAKLDAPLEVLITLRLSDLDGRALQTLSPATLKASADSAEGSVDWTVADVPEGQYFLAARFAGPDGKALVTRTDVVTIAPASPALLAAAEAALAKAVAGKSGVSPLVREVSLPSVEMRVEDAKMRWYDFGR